MARDRYRADGPDLEVTPRELFFNRRAFIHASVGAMALGTIGCSETGAGAPGGSRGSATPADPIGPPPEGPPDRRIYEAEEGLLDAPLSRPDVFPTTRNDAYPLPDVIPPGLTNRLDAARHNNFYEFLPGEGGEVWRSADKYVVDPWSIQIGGLCAKPMTIGLDDLFAFPHEERLYHFRCVERWAMNIPWSGFPLRALLEKVEPAADAKYVRFISAAIPEQMPGIAEAPYYDWPYHEALRIDEAMNELAMVVTGVYGEPLLKQHGAPVRLIVPWKYGYKNPKAIVKIEFIKDKPTTFWEKAQPHEYGFLSNVNPNIPHPRWSQAESYWVRLRGGWFPTPIFNGYEKYVGAMYPDEPRTLQKALDKGQTAR